MKEVRVISHPNVINECQPDEIWSFSIRIFMLNDKNKSRRKKSGQNSTRKDKNKFEKMHGPDVVFLFIRTVLIAFISEEGKRCLTVHRRYIYN